MLQARGQAEYAERHGPPTAVFCTMTKWVAGNDYDSYQLPPDSAALQEEGVELGILVCNRVQARLPRPTKDHTLEPTDST